MLFPERRVLTFEAGKCLAQGSRYEYEPQLTNGSVNSFSKKLTFEGKEIFKIKSADSDSLVLIRSGITSSSRHVYRKLNDSLKVDRRVALLGRKFRWENKEFTTSVYFRNDTYLRRPSRNPDRRFSENSWERIGHNGFDIIFFDMDVPYVIESSTDSTINLYTFHKSKLHHLWTEIEQKTLYNE